MEWWEHAIQAVGALRRASKAREAEDEAARAERAAASARAKRATAKSGIGETDGSFAEKRDKAAGCCIVGRKLKDGPGGGETP